ncbi:response regulator [Endothiovibrio diazotrophicus]
MTIKVAGYEVIERLQETARTVVYRARDRQGEGTVVLKVARHDAAPREARARARREYAMLTRLRLDGVIEVRALVEEQHRLVLVLEDVEAESLAGVLATRRLSLPECLILAIRIADTLGRIHQLDVIHKDINPSNILWDQLNDRVRLIDFELATELARERQTALNPNVLEGSLAYMSPEQTGRMNRVIDYRTDLYSFGVTLYRMLTGQLPFQSGDPVEMVHFHLAKAPRAPCEVDPMVPPQLSALVLRLMAKNAEVRYQSAEGVKFDLQRCLEEYTESGAIEPFELGEADVSERLRISQRLYGREAEAALLLKSFDRVGRGLCESILVAGYSGVGKTSLIEEVHRPIVERRGYFVSGKFDQYQRHIPFTGLIQAFREFFAQVLTESDARVAEWRERILSTVGELGQVIVDVIPEAELILGPQPAVTVLSGNEALNRFQTVFENFLDALCAEEHPLALFLDDLQWADPASLKLLQLLMTSQKERHLLILGAYRDNEVAPSHPLMLTLDAVRGEKRFQTVQLGPLDPAHTHQLIADSVQGTLEATRPLAELIHAKTLGNPFFINRLLTTLYEQGLLRLDAARREWRWEIERIRGLAASANVVDLMVAKINTLPEEARELLRQASCLGNQFRLATLAALSGQSRRQTVLALQVAVREELVRPLDESYRNWQWAGEGESAADDPAEEGVGTGLAYQFFHDRIQEAAYSQLSEQARQAVHWRAGNILLERTTAEERDRHLFEIVNHLNLGRPAYPAGDRDLELATLNLLTGRKAQSSAAHAAALSYLRHGLELIAEEGWSEHFELMFDLHLACADATFQCGDHEETEALFAVIADHARDRRHRAALYSLMLAVYLTMGKYADGMHAGQECLRLFGVELPEEAEALEAATEEEYRRIGERLAGRPITQLLAAPEMTDPDRMLVLELLHRTWTCAYMVNYGLGTLAVLKMVSISLEHGHSAFSAFGYIVYGSILSSVREDYDAAYEFGLLAQRLDERFDNVALVPKVNNMFAHTINHYKRPLKSNIPIYEESYRASLACGDLWWGVWAVDFLVGNLLLKGDPLEQVLEAARRYSGYVEKSGDSALLHMLRLTEHVALNLQGATAGDDSLSDDAWDEGAMERELQAIPFDFGLFWYQLDRSLILFLNQRVEEAWRASEEAERRKTFAPGFMLVTEQCFRHGLIAAAWYPHAPEGERPALLEALRTDLAAMQRWAIGAPENYRHKALLMTAELARVEGDYPLAAESYDQAIDAARASDYLQNEAIANELAARFYLERGRPKAASGYLLDARELYLRWGATRKVADLEGRHGERLSGAGWRRARDLTETLTETVVTSSGTSAVSSLDLIAIVKASQALSSEVNLGSLLERLVRIAQENAGAQVVRLLLFRDGMWCLEADASEEGSEMLHSEPIDLDTPADDFAPRALLRYVARTGDTVVEPDLAASTRFGDDPYVQATHPKSAMCLPILRSSQVVGIIYLENNLATGSFSAERIEFLRILASQVVISIENAQLYDGLERKVAERTAELESAKRTAEEATRAKSLFLANMSHEIRTPMNAVMGLSRLALATEVTPQQKDYLEKILGSAETLLGILNDILDFSKVEAGQLTLEQIEFDIRDVLHQVSVVTAIKAQGKGLEMLFELGYDVPRRLVGDPLRLQQILVNLIGNAVKFTREGEIVVNIRPAEQGGEGMLHFSVRDTGPGIEKPVLRRLFDSFTQADDSTTRRYGGTGLGLAISKQLCELMGGRIWAESEVGQGSEFHFVVRLKALEDVPLSSTALDELRNARALIVDDNATARMVHTEMLEHMGLRTHAVDSGTAALVELTRALDAGEPYRLVLLDWNMPGLDGIETALRIRGDLAPSLPLSLLMVTAYHYGEVLEPAERAGIHRVLSKPLTESSLHDAIVDAMFGNKGGPSRHSSHENGGLEEADLARLRGARVLLAEDNALNQQVACELLAAVGIAADTAVNGREVLEMLERSRYDVVLMDIQMPEMDGLTATRRLRADPRHATVPIIAMTAHAMESDREQSLRAGMNDHVTKPIDPQQLYRMLARWLRRRRRGEGEAAEIAPAASPKRETRREEALPPALVVLGEAGIDVRAGLHHHLDRVGFYLRVLRGFAAEYAPARQDLDRYLAEGQWAEALRLCHTLKSAAASIGAPELSQRAARLETQCRDQHCDEADLTGFGEELEALLGLLRGLESEAAEVRVRPPLPAGKAAALRPLIDIMEQRLRTDDAMVSDCIPAISVLLDGAAADVMKEIVEAVEDLEYATALKHIDGLRSLLK